MQDSCAILLILPAQTQWGLSGFLSITEGSAITLPVWCSKLPKHIGLDGGGCWLVNFIIPFFGKINSISEMQAGAPHIIPKWQRDDKYRTQLGFSATGTNADDAVF